MRSLHKSRFLAAFFLTVIVFLLIIITNNYFNEARMNKLNSIYNDIRIDALNAEVQYEIISENPCLALNFNPIASEIFNLGGKLTEMESSFGKKNSQVLDLKKYYSILEIRQYLFVKKASEQCNKTAVPVLFFYSNEEDCGTCENQGFVLGYVKKSMPNVYIYSFDVNLDSIAVKTLMTQYDITKTPALVIHDKTYEGFKDADEILSIIRKSHLE